MEKQEIPRDIDSELIKTINHYNDIFALQSEKDRNFTEIVSSAFMKALDSSKPKIIVMFDIDETIGHLDKNGRTIIRPVLEILLEYLLKISQIKDKQIKFGLLSTRNNQEIFAVKNQITGYSELFDDKLLLSCKQFENIDGDESCNLQGCLNENVDIYDLFSSEKQKLHALLAIQASSSESIIITVDDSKFEKYIDSQKSPLIGVHVDYKSDLR